MNPAFQLVDSGWDKVIAEAVSTDHHDLRIVCPFIKVKTAQRLLKSTRSKPIQVITRFHLGEMCDGVNDTEAFRLLLNAGAKIRGIRNLHSKLYLFGNQRVIVTSANLTEAALFRNHEFGFVSNESSIMARCSDYFDGLWKKAGPDLHPAKLEDWEKRIASVRVGGARPSASSSLPDEGTSADSTGLEIEATPRVEEASQAFIKFFGEGHRRMTLDMPTLTEVDRSGCHWACGYPRKKRPRSVQDGAVMFMGRLVKEPNDTVIYGWAIALRHVEGRDEASAAEIKQRDWKRDWPIYVRVHHAEFVAGTLANGIRLSTLMDKLKSDSFVSTQRNAKSGEGNTDPRGAYRQQAQVQLTRKAFNWLKLRLEQSFAQHGKLTRSELEGLDWPTTQASPTAWKEPEHLTEYQKWLVAADAKRLGTAKIYARFLIRCAEHYGETINDQTVRTEADVQKVIDRVDRVVKGKDRWTKGAFNQFDVDRNLIFALQAYVRFVQANPLGKPGKG